MCEINGNTICYRVHGQMPFLDAVYTMLKENSFEREMIGTVTKLFSNFAKYG